MPDDRDLVDGEEVELQPGQDRAALEQPGGLLGLLLWPLRAAISLALQVFAAFVKGVLGAIFPALRHEPEQPDDGQPPEVDQPDGSGQ